MRSDLGFYRILSVISALSVTLFRPMLPTDSYDPIWLRLCVSAVAIGFGVLSYLVPMVKRRIAFFAHIVIYAVSFWAAFLIFKNDFQNAYVVNFFVVVLFSAINIKNLKIWVPYAITILFGLTFSSIFAGASTILILELAGLITLCLLITAAMVIFRTNIQAELNRQGKFVESIFESSPDAMFQAHASTKEVFRTNTLAANLFGIESEANRTQLHQHLSKWLSDFLGKKEVTGRQLAQLSKLNGEKIWAEIVLTKIQGDFEDEYLVSVSDVTERNIIQQRLQLSDDILKKVDHLVIVVNKTAEVIYITPSVEKMLGYSPKQMLGNGWWDTKEKNGFDTSAERAHILSVARGEAELNTLPYENQVIDANGQVQWMLWQNYLTATGMVMGVGMLNTNAKKDSLIRSVVFSIAEASSKAQNPIEFYHNIHQQIRRIIDTPNFYIAVYNADVDEVAFPYYSDSEESDYLARSGHRRKAGKGLTEYVIAQKKAHLLNQEAINELLDKGLVQITGTLPKVWLGVPMVHEDRVVGLMTVQNYQNEQAYSQDDLELVNFVAGQVAQFVAKLQADEALKLSEERFRSIYDQAAVGIAQLAPKGNFMQVNHKMSDIFGYSTEELSKIAPVDITHPDDIDLGADLLQEVLEGTRDSYTIEKRYLHKKGKTIYALVNVSAYREEGMPIFIISVYEDITEKKRAQAETEWLLRLTTRLNAANTLAEVMEIAAYKLSILGDWGLVDAIWHDQTGTKFLLKKVQCSVKDITILERAEIPDFSDSLHTDHEFESLIWLDPKVNAPLPYDAKHVALLPIIYEGKTLAVFSLISWQEEIDILANEKSASLVGAQLLTIMLRKLADAAKEESENRYRAITQAAFDGIAIYQDNKFQDVNLAFAKIFDYDPQEIAGIPLEELIYAESPSEVAAEIVGGNRSEVEFEGRKKSGKAIFLEALSRDDTWQGRPAKILAIRDITSQKLMEETRAAAKIDARFKAYVQNSSEIIQILDTEGKITYCSPSSTRILGINPEFFIGKLHSDLVSDTDRASFETVLKDIASKEGSTAQLQLGLQISEDKIRFLQVNMTNLLEDPLVKGILLSAGDISSVIEAQQSMKESEERYKALVENATEAIFVLDINQAKFTEVNRNAEILFGYDRETLLKIDPELLNANDQSDRMSLEYATRAMKGEIVTFEWQFKNQLGEIIPCEVRLNRFPSSTQKLVRGSITDITERKKSEVRMQRSREMLRLQNEKLIELAASHELNSGDLDRAFEEITKALSTILQVSKSSIWLFDDEFDSLVCRKQYYLDSGMYSAGEELAISDFPNYFEQIRQARFFAVEDVHSASEVAEFIENYFDPQDIKSVLDAPFRHGGKVAGVIWNEQMNSKRNWEQEELNFVASIADMVTLALQSWEKKKAEGELANTLTKMRATFDSTRDGIVMVDPFGNLLDYNDEYQKLSKIPEEILKAGGQNAGFEHLLNEVVDPEPFLEAVTRMEKNPDAGERYIYQTKDQLVLEIYVRKMVVNGELRGRLWFLHDLTDLKRIETALLENEAKYRSLFSQANDSIILLDEHIIIECNDKAEEMFGTSRDNIIGKSPDELSPNFQPNGRRSSKAAAAYIDAAHQGEPQYFNWQHQRADGTPFDAEVGLNRIQIGEKTYVQALVRDITERLKTENALRESERKNKALLDGIPDLIIRLTMRGTILDIKLSDNQDLVQADDTALGRSIKKYLPEPIVSTLMEEAKACIETEESRRFESELQTSSGSNDYETRIVRSGPGEVLAIIRDVTEQKKTEKELIKRNFELDSFVYRASHDLKAPLNSLMGLISLVQAETEEASVLNYITMMNKSVVKLDSFIRDLADFSRNARMEMENSEIKWGDLLHETLENLQFADNSDRIKKIIEINQKVAFLSDPIRIGIILNNLISNAIKYQNLKAEDAFVKIKIETDENYAKIIIQDNGIGISEEHQSKVYNLFFRASIQSYGSGMGMYIVKNAVDKLRGEIDMQSKEGEGTKFEILIPNALESGSKS